jgi:predicted dehydrogenase
MFGEHATQAESRRRISRPLRAHENFALPARMLRSVKRIDAVLIGAGQRGADAYAPYALTHPDRLRFLAVAEPHEERRRRFAEAHHIPPERQFSDADALFALGRIADAAFICTPDQAHVDPARKAMALGYHLLLEKPFATTPEACADLVARAKTHGVRMEVCHVARHARHFERLNDIVHSGVLGEIVHIDHSENVSYWHMAHSYVRGNWRSAEESAPMILAKCCHDLDLLGWWMREPVTRLASVGGLKHFRADRAPEGAPMRCTDGCPAKDTCPFFAPRIYGSLTPLFDSAAHGSKLGPRLAFEIGGAMAQLLHEASTRVPVLRKFPSYDGWPRSVLDADPTPDNIDRALREGPYGRCVYHCDNDVVDHQVVCMELASGTTLTLTMHGHSAIEERITRIQGARASLTARLGLANSDIEVIDHANGQTQRIDTTSPRLDGHGGGDLAFVDAFVRALAEEDYSEHGDEALESHLLAFAAEEARVTGQWIDMGAYRARYPRRSGRAT